MRLIDADVLFEDCLFSTLELERGLKEFINDAPTVEAVPVVRCKDCQHYWKNGGDNSKGAVCLVSPKDDAFCSEGERKDDETERT